MAVEPDGVVKSLNVLEDQGVSLGMSFNTETVQPFPFDQGVEGFDTGVIVGITFVAVAQLELFGSVPISLGNVLKPILIKKDIDTQDLIQSGRYDTANS